MTRTRAWGGGLLVAALWFGGDCPGEARSAGGVGQAASPGSVTFGVDSREKRFDSLPDGHNTYTPLASTIKAVPSAGGREHLMITFMAIDLKKLEYPVHLPRPRGTGQPPGPMAAMASVGFSYIDEAGREWAGPGRLRIEAFGRDGVVTGSFTDISLPHTGKQLANVTLRDGTFRARISSPW